MSTKSDMIVLCPICKEQGYLIKEKARKKRQTPTLRDLYKRQKISYGNKPSMKYFGLSYFSGRNIIWKDYDSTSRIPSEYYRIKHNYRIIRDYGKNGHWYRGPIWKSRFCYIGDLGGAISKIKEYSLILKAKNDEESVVWENWSDWIDKNSPENKKLEDLTEDDVLLMHQIMYSAKKKKILIPLGYS